MPGSWDETELNMKFVTIPELIQCLAISNEEARAHDGTKYVPGVVGLNNKQHQGSIEMLE